MRFSFEAIVLLLATANFAVAAPAPDATPIPKAIGKFYKQKNCKAPTTPAQVVIPATSNCVTIPASNSYNYTLNKLAVESECRVILFPEAGCTGSGSVFDGNPGVCNNNPDAPNKLISAALLCGG